MITVQSVWIVLSFTITTTVGSFGGYGGAGGYGALAGGFGGGGGYGGGFGGFGGGYGGSYGGGFGGYGARGGGFGGFGGGCAGGMAHPGQGCGGGCACGGGASCVTAVCTCPPNCIIHQQVCVPLPPPPPQIMAIPINVPLTTYVQLGNECQPIAPCGPGAVCVQNTCQCGSGFFAAGGACRRRRVKLTERKLIPYSNGLKFEYEYKEKIDDFEKF